MKKWVDPSQGWLYGFPKVWDEEKDGPLLKWMVKEGYPQPKTDEEGACSITYRSWPVDD